MVLKFCRIITSRFPVLDNVASCDEYKSETSDLLKKHLNAEKVVCFDFQVLFSVADYSQRSLTLALWLQHRIHTKFEKGE